MKHARLHAAVSAAAAASHVTRLVQQSLQTVGEITKDDRSPVTVADFAAQAVVQHVLASMLEDEAPPRIVGEESAGVLREDGRAKIRRRVVEAVQQVWNDADDADVMRAIDACNHDASADAYWTLDPVDGTKGFLRGGQYAISLAWIEGGEVALGVLACPNLSPDFSRDFNNPDPVGLIYYATSGGGTFEISVDDALRASRADDPNHEPKQIVLDPQQTSQRIRVCESVESSHTKHDDTAKIVEALGGGGTPARLDSQCKYAVVARGQADAYLRMPTRPGYVEKIWDHAAGMVVAAEAGAVVSDVQGRPLDFSHGPRLEANRGVICATPQYHARIIEAIEALQLAPAG